VLIVLGMGMWLSLSVPVPVSVVSRRASSSLRCSTSSSMIILEMNVSMVDGSV